MENLLIFAFVFYLSVILVPSVLEPDKKSETHA